MIFRYIGLHVSVLLMPSSDPSFYMAYAWKYAYCNVYPHLHRLLNIKYFKKYIKHICLSINGRIFLLHVLGAKMCVFNVYCSTIMLLLSSYSH
jgi:hypothetical protein